MLQQSLPTDVMGQVVTVHHSHNKAEVAGPHVHEVVGYENLVKVFAGLHARHKEQELEGDNALGGDIGLGHGDAAAESP